MKSDSTSNLKQAIEYLEARLKDRLTGKAADSDVFPEFELLPSSDSFSQLIARLELSIDEFIVLVMAVVPHIYPDFYDRIISQHLEQDSDLPALGGVKTNRQRSMMPTLATVLYVLAGEDLEKRSVLLELFDVAHPFSKYHLIYLSTAEEGESMLNRQLLLAPEYQELLVKGFVAPPQFSSSFPAQCLTTELDWEDLVLPPATLSRIEEIKIWVLHHRQLMNDWGMKRLLKPGYRALFHGPPGTGKTLTASLLGKYTEREVYRVDLSTVVSKFIGETEKNLANLFDRAQHKNWVLFFDEADALFGKRTQVKNAHDRYANQEVSYLLQRVEDFDGLIILASNFKENMDDAFLRRFNTIIRFPFPSKNERTMLWKQSFPKHLTFEQHDFYEKAAYYELSGGSIVNVVQYACLQAIQKETATIVWEDVQTGIQREIEKEGRMFKPVY